MISPLTITVTRNGQKVSLPFRQCSEGEITGYFQSLSHQDLLVWAYLLAGYACGSDARIEELEKRNNDTTRGP